MKTLMLLQALILAMYAVGQSPASADQSITGEWQLTTTMLKISSASRLLLSQSGNEIKGSTNHEGDHVD